MTREKADAGQTLDACGMWRSAMRVGRMTLKPETKYSVRIWDITTEKTKASSAQRVGKTAGRSRPRRSMRACSVSSLDGCFAVGWEGTPPSDNTVEMVLSPAEDVDPAPSGALIAMATFWTDD